MKYYKLNYHVFKKLKPFQKRASALGYWVKATNEMKLGWFLSKKWKYRINVGWGWIIIVHIFSKGYIHNDDGSIWDIYDVEK